jgi:ribonuclease HII
MMNLYEFDQHIRTTQGIIHLAGVDEAGRGPLAGPVVAAAVVLDTNHPINGVNDSKQLSPTLRSTLFYEIISHAASYAVVSIESRVIDQINILNATKQAMVKALEQLEHPVDYIISDAVPLNSPLAPCEPFIKGDTKSASIAAASILAKVTRDQLMIAYHKTYPEYGFHKHKGYPTKAHLEALRQLGPCPIHRYSYKPVHQASLL